MCVPLEVVDKALALALEVVMVVAGMVLALAEEEEDEVSVVVGSWELDKGMWGKQGMKLRRIGLGEGHR